MQIFCNLEFIVYGWLYSVHPATLYTCCLCFSEFNLRVLHVDLIFYIIYTLSSMVRLLICGWLSLDTSSILFKIHIKLHYSDNGLNTRQKPILVFFIMGCITFWTNIIIQCCYLCFYTGQKIIPIDYSRMFYFQVGVFSIITAYLYTILSVN